MLVLPNPQFCLVKISLNTAITQPKHLKVGMLCTTNLKIHPGHYILITSYVNNYALMVATAIHSRTHVHHQVLTAACCLTVRI